MQDHPPPYATIVFDCDSTLSSIEGICELAGDEHAEELERLTAGAMDGTAPLEEVYGRRLELVGPTRADLERVGRRYIETALPYTREVVQALHSLGKSVVVVSGGLLPPVRTLASTSASAPSGCTRSTSTSTSAASTPGSKRTRPWPVPEASPS